MRWCKWSCGIAAPSTCRRPSRRWRRTRKSAVRSRKPSSCRRSDRVAVIPAKAGIQTFAQDWLPACAGMSGLRSVSMKKWNMIIDVAECTNCNLCTLATMDEYVGNEWPGYTKPMPKHGHKWINILQKERGQIPMIDIAYVPTMCNHCDNAPCIAKSDGAITKRDDGIVLIDQERAKGRKDLVDACPYGHIWWNEELGVPQHWP